MQSGWRNERPNHPPLRLPPRARPRHGVGPDALDVLAVLAGCDGDDMSELPKLIWLRIRSEADLQRITKNWVKAQCVNTYNGPRQDKKGDWIITLGYDDKPDSDWGRFKGNRAAIWFSSEVLADAGEKSVRLALGWKVSETAP